MNPISYYKLLILFLAGLLLASCSGNGFHLRKDVKLSGAYQSIAINGVSAESELYKKLSEAILDAGGRVVTEAAADSAITIRNLAEDKNVVAYTDDLDAREYLIYLRFDYVLQAGPKKLQRRSINLEKTLIYDASFVLGEAEEENRIRQALREEAARLILLRLEYSKL